ncbi:hypothetical protein [Sphingobacterium kitahiroshimense]|uniref:Uncharacterized protein n=1 Tax=Sphingobacterium kitahiroshimense TaxID=470446 RepID=A0ABV0BVZ1_9SPHI
MANEKMKKVLKDSTADDACGAAKEEKIICEDTAGTGGPDKRRKKKVNTAKKIKPTGKDQETKRPLWTVDHIALY